MVVDVKTALKPTMLCLEVHGKEKIVGATGDGSPGGRHADNATSAGNEGHVEHCFFFVRLDLYRTESPIAPNQYVMPFSIPLPKSLPASRSNRTHVGDEETLNSNADDNQLDRIFPSFSVQYNLKLKSDAPEKFPNKRSFLVSPPLSRPVPCLLQPRPWNLGALRIDGAHHQYEGLVYMAIRAEETTVARGGALALFLAVRNTSTCQVAGVRVTLEQECHHSRTKATTGTRLATDSTASGADRVQKVILSDVNPVARNLDGIRLSSTSCNHRGVDKQAANEEQIATEMFRSLYSPLNTTVIRIPMSAKETYTGVQVRILHFVTVSLIPACVGIDLPSLRFPVHVVGETTVHQGSSAHPRSSAGISVIHQQEARKVMDPILENTCVRLPLAVASSMKFAFGRDYVDQSQRCRDESENEIASSRPSKELTHLLPMFLDELRGSMDECDFVEEKLKNLEFAIFLGSLNPSQFGSVMAATNSDFSKPRIGALLAQNYAGDFTCAHVASAIQNTSDIFRVNVVDGLLGFCSDLVDNNELVRCQLTDFEQIVVALRALGVGQTTIPSNSGAETIASKEEASTMESCADFVSTQSDNCNLPGKNDVCIDVEHHPGTLEFISAIKKVVSDDASQGFSPQLYRRIMKQFPERRFMLRPIANSLEYWREASRKELIEFVGRSYEQEVANCRQKMTYIHEDISWEDPEESRWEDSLAKKGDSDWPLAITIHSYTSTAKEQEENEPTPRDVCFGGSPEWSGNRAMLRAVRRVLADAEDEEWGPKVYKTIKSSLFGRRFFVLAGTNQWNEASMNERIDKLGLCYVREKLGDKGQVEPIFFKMPSTTQPGGEPSVEKSMKSATTLPTNVEWGGVDELRQCSPQNSPLRAHSGQSRSDASKTKGSAREAERGSPLRRRSLLKSPARLAPALESPKLELINSTPATKKKTLSAFHNSLLQSPDRLTQSFGSSKLPALRSPRRLGREVDLYMNDDADSRLPKEDVSAFRATLLHSPYTLKATLPDGQDRMKKFSKTPNGSGYRSGEARSPKRNEKKFIKQTPSGTNGMSVHTLSIKKPSSKDGERGKVSSPGAKDSFGRQSPSSTKFAGIYTSPAKRSPKGGKSRGASSPSAKKRLSKVLDNMHSKQNRRYDVEPRECLANSKAKR